MLLTILSFITATEEKNKKSIKFTDLKKFMEKIFLMNDVSWFLPDYMSEDVLKMSEDPKDPSDVTIQLVVPSVPAPEFNLFLFCILTNRIESAMLFLRLGRVTMKINPLG